MELNYKTYGKGDPVVILHGLFGMLDNWQSFARELSKEYLVVVPDLPNHGRSPAMDPFNYPEMSEAVTTFLQDHWIYDCHLIGHSMGGKTAMQLALDHPDMVSHLLVVDIAPREYEGGHDEIFQALQNLEPEKAKSRGELQKELTSVLRREEVVLFLMKNLSRRKEGGYRWKFELELLQKYYTQILAGIESDHTFDKPTLFVGGELSDYIVEADRDDILKLFPSAEIEQISGAGHWIHADKPGELMKRTLEFFR